MECQQCGARRPPSGPCPNCGAYPAGRSSLRGWSDRTASPSSQGGRGGPGTSWGRGGSGSNWGGRGGSGAGWGGHDQGAGGRTRGPADDYGDDYEVDLGRALVPSTGMVPDLAGGAPVVPGMPTEEEERLLGIRHPVYIPATGKRRRSRLGSWRILSGVVSVIVVCLGACAVTSLLGKGLFGQYIAGLTGRPYTSSPIDYSQVPGTPVATPGKSPAAKYVISVTTAKQVDVGANPVNISSKFVVNERVYVVANIQNVPQGQKHLICVGWYLNGQYLQFPPNSQVCATLDGTSTNYHVKLELDAPQPGVYMARLYWDPPANVTANYTDFSSTVGQLTSTLVASIRFGIYEPAALTPTAAPARPSPSPTKSGATPSPSARGAAPGAISA
jgi:hypothetical protein